MNNLKIRKFDKSILDKAKLITKGFGFFKTYDLNNGNIIKVVKDVDECLSGCNGLQLYTTYNEFMNEIINKITYSIDIESNSVVLPNSIYLEKGEFRAYTIPKQENMLDLRRFFSENKDLETISKTIIDLSLEVQKLNKQNIYLPDLGNATNVLINPKDKCIKFIDYDGMQIDKYCSFNISKIICNDVNPFTRNKKYCDFKTGLINSSMDKLTLYTLFLFYTSNTLITNFNEYDYTIVDGKLKIKEDSIRRYCREIGISDTSLEEDIFKIYSNDRLNYPNTSIKRLLKTHTLNNGKFILK